MLPQDSREYDDEKGTRFPHWLVRCVQIHNGSFCQWVKLADASVCVLWKVQIKWPLEVVIIDFFVAAHAYVTAVSTVERVANIGGQVKSGWAGY